jgi:hypothetical protein
LRRIEARAATGSLRGVRISLHPELADAFQNGRRQELAGLEREHSLRIEVIASSRLHRNQQEVDWFHRGKPELRTTLPPTSAPSVHGWQVTEQEQILPSPAEAAIADPTETAERAAEPAAERAAETAAERAAETAAERAAETAPRAAASARGGDNGEEPSPPKTAKAKRPRRRRRRSRKKSAPPPEAAPNGKSEQSSS